MKFITAVIVAVAMSAMNAQAVTDSNITNGGAICSTVPHGIACYRTDGHGLGIGISHDFVFVQNVVTKKVLFARVQPR